MNWSKSMGQCETCDYEKEIHSSGVHQSQGGCVKVYCDADEFNCPNCDLNLDKEPKGTRCMITIAALSQFVDGFFRLAQPWTTHNYRRYSSRVPCNNPRILRDWWFAPVLFSLLKWWLFMDFKCSFVRIKQKQRLCMLYMIVENMMWKNYITNLTYNLHTIWLLIMLCQSSLYVLSAAVNV